MIWMLILFIAIATVQLIFIYSYRSKRRIEFNAKVDLIMDILNIFREKAVYTEAEYPYWLFLKGLLREAMENAKMTLDIEKKLGEQNGNQ